MGRSTIWPRAYRPIAARYPAARAARHPTAGLRQSWFELRAIVKTIAEKAAADYAALTHEAPRTIEHVASVNAWDGQHEASSLEVLAPEHERAFMDAACDALGVVLIRPYVGEQEFRRFWAAYQPTFGALP